MTDTANSSTSSSPGAVLLDIDGTLVDSNYLHTYAWVKAFHEVGHPGDSWRVHRAVGMGSALLLEELLGVEVAEKVGADAKERHSAIYAELGDLQRVLPGARELVHAVGELFVTSHAAPMPPPRRFPAGSVRFGSGRCRPAGNGSRP